MIRCILIIATVIVVLATAAMAYSGGRLENGSFVDLQQCGDRDSTYYNSHESQCDTLEFYVPVFAGPFWLILLVLWYFQWLGHRRNRASAPRPA